MLKTKLKQREAHSVFILFGFLIFVQCFSPFRYICSSEYFIYLDFECFIPLLVFINFLLLFLSFFHQLSTGVKGGGGRNVYFWVGWGWGAGWGSFSLFLSHFFFPPLSSFQFFFLFPFPIPLFYSHPISFVFSSPFPLSLLPFLFHIPFPSTFLFPTLFFPFPFLFLYFPSCFHLLWTLYFEFSLSLSTFPSLFSSLFSIFPFPCP